MAARPFDAARQVTMEDGPFDGLPLVRPRIGQPLDPTALPPAATVTDLTSDHVRVEAPDGAGGFLVLTDLYHRGWRARVDGQPQPVYLANFLFRAVYLEPGEHEIVFRFMPPSYRAATIASFASLIAIAGLVAVGCALGRRDS